MVTGASHSNPRNPLLTRLLASTLARRVFLSVATEVTTDEKQMRFTNSAIRWHLRDADCTGPLRLPASTCSER